MIRRARMIAVLAILLAGTIGLISSGQAWVTLQLQDAHAQALDIPGSAALPLLMPMSLTALALAAVLTMIGRSAALVLGVVAAAIGVWMFVQNLGVVSAVPLAVVAEAVAGATGIEGQASVSELVATMAATAWPTITLAVWVILAASGIFVLVTAKSWVRTGRRYSTAAPTHHAAGPLDAVDSWDELSRGDDPTADGPQTDPGSR